MSNYFHTPLQSLLLKRKIREDDDLIKIFKYNVDVTNMINQEITGRMNGIIDNFVTILIQGEQGTMKSSVGIELAKRTDNNWATHQLAFLYQEFNSKINDSLPKQSFILDEQIYQHGVGSLRIIQDLQTLIETLRKRQNSMILISVEPKYFPETIFTLTFETVDNKILGVCQDNQELHEVRNCPLHIDKEHLMNEIWVRCLVKKNERYMGFYITAIDWNSNEWEEYCLLKDKFLEKAPKGDFQKLQYETLANEIMSDPSAQPYFNKRKSMKLYLEKKHPNLTTEEKNLLIEQILILRGESL